MSDTSQGPGWWLASDGNWCEPNGNLQVAPGGTNGPSGERIAPALAPTMSAGSIQSMKSLAGLVGALLVIALLLASCGGTSASYEDGYNFAVRWNTLPGQTLCDGDACGVNASNSICEGFTTAIPPGDVGHDWLLGCEAAAEANATSPLTH